MKDSDAPQLRGETLRESDAGLSNNRTPSRAAAAVPLHSSPSKKTYGASEREGPFMMDVGRHGSGGGGIMKKSHAGVWLCSSAGWFHR